MKTSRIAALALIASAAIGMNAFAQSNDAGIDPAQNFVSTANAAQVRSEAAQANLERVQRGYSQDSGEYISGTPAFKSNISREAVRTEAIQSNRISMTRLTEAG